MANTDLTRLDQYQPPAQLLQGKNILVTGANRGIGRAVSLACAQHGATVILLGRDESALEAIYDEIEKSGGPQPVLVPFDLGSAADEQYEDLNNQIVESLGGLHGLLHNAGLLGEMKPLAQYPVDTFREVIAVNLTSNFLLTRALLPAMEQVEHASVVFTSSSVGRKGRAYWGAYGISKFGVEGMMQTWADELDQVSGIRCNSINPKATRTKMRAQAYPGETVEQNPEPDAIVPAYLFLLGDDSIGVNGQQLDAR